MITNTVITSTIITISLDRRAVGRSLPEASSCAGWKSMGTWSSQQI